MRKFLIVTALVASIGLTGCEADPGHINNILPPTTAKKILENREKYVAEIRATVVECLSNSNKNRDVKYNDSNEVVETCTRYAQDLYGAYSVYGGSTLIKQANKVGEKK